MPQSSYLIGASSGYTFPGAPPFQDDFPSEVLSSHHVRRFAETWMATAQGQTLTFKPSWNDCVNLFRTMMSNGLLPLGGAAKPPNVLAAFAPSRHLRGLAAQPFLRANGTNASDIFGNTLTYSGGSIGRGGMDLLAAGLITAVAQNDNVALVATLNQDPTTLTGLYFHLRRTDGNNWIRAAVQAVGNIRVEKDVATVVTTEADIPIDVGEDIAGGAIGLRINGTNMKVFMNGTMYGNFTLSAGAQGLAGTLAGIEVTDVGRHRVDAISIFKT